MMQSNPQRALQTKEIIEQWPWSETGMSQNPVMCRICLSTNVRMFPLTGTYLQSVYEKIVDTPLQTADMRPLTACYMCYAQLKKCHRLMTMAAKSENILTEIMETYPEVSTRSAALINYEASNLYLSTIPVEYFDTFSFDSSTDDNFDQECVKLENEIKYEEVEYGESVESEMIEYDVNTVKCESNVDVDMSKSTDEGTPLNIKVKLEAQVDAQNDESPVQDTEMIHEDIPTESEEQEPSKNSKQHRIYQCNLCLRVFTNTKSYSYHLESHQINECNFCKTQFSNRNNLMRHLSTHSEDKPYQCDICNRRFRLKDYLKRHIDVHNAIRKAYQNENYKCSVCQRYFAQKSALTSHLRTHTGEKPFECDVCHKGFSSKFNLQTHLRTHSGEKPFRCDICKAGYIHRSSLNQHMLTHTGERPHMCKFCKRAFRSTSHLKDHLKRHKNKSPLHESDSSD